jgi:hypothetical protein
VTTIEATNATATIANPTIVIKTIDATIALNATTRTQKAQSPTTRRMIASAITSKKRVTRPCIMTSPLCQAPAIHPKEGADLVPDLLCVLVLGLTLTQAAGATSTIMSTKTIASQVQLSITGICTTRTTMTDMPSYPLKRQQRSTPRNRQLHQ